MRSSRRSLRSCVLAFVVAGAVVACQVVAGIERVDKAEPAPPEAGIDAALPDAAVVDPCGHVLPPPPPSGDDAPNDKLDDIYLALHQATLVPDTAAKIVGYDLDRACTCDTRPGAAFDGGGSCTSKAQPFCDLDGGVDNQSANILRDYSAFIDIDKAANINGRIAAGRQTAILVISRYNGRANDSEVSFGLFSSEGMQEGATCPGSTTDTEGFTLPGWCGEDVWTASASTVEGTSTKFVPKSVGAGYVSNYRFVVELNNSASVPFAGYRLTMGSPVSSGRLVPLDDKLVPIDVSQGPALERIKYWRLEDAILAGRIPSATLLAALGTVVTPGGADGGASTHLCTSPLFDTLKSTLCDRLDINGSKALDFIPGAQCDAISVAMGMTADSVRVRTVVAAPAASNECYPTEDGGAPMAGPPGIDYRCP